MFRLEVNKVTLRVREREPVTSGSYNIYLCRYEFSREWDGLHKTAVFRAGSAEKSVVLDESNQCQIPHEVLVKPGLDLFAGVLGTRNGEKILPTMWAKLEFIKPGTNSAEASVPPTPGVYEQILAEAMNAKQIAQGVREDADNGLLPGALPDGGTKGQVLTKRSDADGDAGWADGDRSGGDADTLDGLHAADFVAHGCTVKECDSYKITGASEKRTVYLEQGDVGEVASSAGFDLKFGHMYATSLPIGIGSAYSAWVSAVKSVYALYNEGLLTVPYAAYFDPQKQTGVKVYFDTGSNRIQAVWRCNQESVSVIYEGGTDTVIMFDGSLHVKYRTKNERGLKYLPQTDMEADPASEMQIATKQYVDNAVAQAIQNMPAGRSLGVLIDDVNVAPALTASLAVADGAGLTPMETIESISSVYEGGDVAVGTAVTDLTGITVAATYIDGTTEPIADYTLSGEITEGENTITVNYYSYTATFTVNGVAETEVTE